MKMIRARVLVVTGMAAGTALVTVTATRSLTATAAADQPPKREGIVFQRDHLGKIEDLPPLTPVPTPVPNGMARDRGCRTGGVRDINTTNPSWVSVRPEDASTPLEGIVHISQVTHEDFPTNHESHDWNFLIGPDPQYRGLASDANGKRLNELLVECEWETKHFPDAFLPAPRDRAYVLGRWVFDCGHPPYRSEIHPPKLTAFTRLEPYIFRGDSAPSFTNKTLIYLNGQGGYFYDPLGGVSYEFYVPLPPKPSETAVARAEVVSVPFGGIAPQLTLEPAQNRVKVVYPLRGLNEAANKRWNLYRNSLFQRPRQNTARFGAIVASGWREPRLTKGYKILRVDLRSVKINHDHDPFASGEWRMWIRVNGVWTRIQGLGDVDDGETVRINKSITVMVPMEGSVSLQATGWESDPIDDSFSMDSPGSLPSPRALDNNERIGKYQVSYFAGHNFGIGTHTVRSTQNGDSETKGDYHLTYQITEVGGYPVGTRNAGRFIPKDRIERIERLPLEPLKPAPLTP
jgi:hypothetical protein